MILQIDKVRKVAKGDITKQTTDYIDGVARTFTSLNEVTAVMRDGSELTIGMGYDSDPDVPHAEGEDLIIKIAPLEPFYRGDHILKVWLLNDEGKTLKNLI